ncbi:26S proteasome regulatory subunit 6A homolog [Cajanus cajan]|uniref:26S proteasome regulatory subunit 6A homolog n=1 Tax=Cajanus cajan TaxID=3821 RepID=UPI0010FBA186|nr:26S proteasome regulatory subunit 6A homolog [Cajanus cajan]XP_029128750.1 26S proteasome regulatory subunit 6A homolog [Cajanus cajan]
MKVLGLGVAGLGWCVILHLDKKCVVFSLVNSRIVFCHVVIVAINCADILYPTLMHSWLLDFKIEFLHPIEEGLRFYRSIQGGMNVHLDVNFEELASSTGDFNGAQLKAVCVEAGMLALCCDAIEIIKNVSHKKLRLFEIC